MEMTFDGMERATQQERFEKLRGVYPPIAQICDPGPWMEEAMPVTFRIESVYKLRLLELMLYFRQEKKRIARCDYCWNYFIPMTVLQYGEWEENARQERVAGDPDFDPVRKYPPSMMVLDLRDTADDPHWQFLSQEDLIRKDQAGHQSLRDEYGKRPDKPPAEEKE